MKALRRLFAALLLLSATVANALAFEVDGIYYYPLDNLTAEVIRCSSSSFTSTGAVTIPATVTYDGFPFRVTSIGNEVFRDCRSLTSITIPEGVTYIGELAFFGCSNLTAITIPESVTYIGESAFSYTNLTSITLPEGVTSIGEGTFQRCSSLTSITLPEGVTSIGECAFYGCSSLTAITLPEGVTSIEYDTFYGCSSLTSIVIPESVTTIGNGAFCDCNSLQKVIIPKYVTSIGQSAFKSCSSLATVVSFSTVAPTIGYDCFLDINSDAILYNLPESDYSAWEPYFSSTSTLSYYLRHVKTGFFMTSGAYWGTCAVLGETGIDMTVTPLPNGRYTIDTQIFNGSQHHLGSNGYVDAERTEWIIEAQSEGLYTMSADGTHYFGSTEGTNVLDFSCTDPSTEGALWEFVDKKDLIAELNGASVTAPINATFLIPGGSFNVFDSRNANWQGSPNIGGYRNGTRANYCAEKFNTSFDVYQDFAGLPNGLYKVRVQGFYRMGSAWDAATNRQLGTEVLNASLYANEESCPLMSIFEGATTTIGYTYGVVAGTEYGKIPNDMESAASFFTDGKFWNEVWVIVTNGTLRIGVKKNELVKDDWACFDNFELHYYGVNQPVIGVSLDRTSAKIIEGESLTLTAALIPSNATDVITWSSSNNAVATVDTNGTVTAKSLGTAIITAKVGEYAATCEVEVVGYYFTDSSFEHLVITNDYDYLSSDSYPWDDYRARIKTVEIKNGVTEIGCYAFEGCSSLQSITIPESVNSIEQAAFRRCSSLQNITIPESVTSIGRYAFNSCSSLQSITIPERVNSIGEGAFNNCSSLAEVKSLSTTAPTIGPGCFSQIHSGATLHYPAISDYSEWWKSYFSNRKVIHYYFRNYLRHLVIIGDYNDCFSSDSYPWHNVRAGIETIEIKNGVTGIGNYEFADCSSLQSIIIPESVNSIGQAAFKGCSSLQSIIIPEGVTSIRHRTFEDCSSLQSITIPESVTSIGEYAFKSCSSLAAVTSQSTTAPTIGPECFSDINSNAILYNPPGSDYSAWEPYFSSVLNPATKITLDQNVVTITEGEILTLTATITPDDAIDKAVTWSSSDESVATVINGLVTALAPGTAAITAQVEDKTATCVVTVEKRIIPVSSISLNRTSADIEGGETLVLTAAVSPNNATYNTVIWSSSNTSVAIVDNNGKVIGVGSGTAIITAKAGEKSATCEVKVTIPVSSISLSRTYAALAGDESITLTATVSPDNATYKTVTWSSSNEDVAIVDNGKVTARSAGVATITATADGVTAACEVNVNGWKFDNVTGHLFVNDVIDCKYYTSYPWYEISGNVLSVEFGDQATTIGKQAFATCASLMTVTMSDSVKSIGDEAFYECIGLMSVEFSNNLESIGDYAFAQCVGLTSIDIPNSISNIQNYAFTDCDGLINVFIPSSVTNIGNGAFADCDGLSSIVIPSSVITIGSNTFSNCDGLTSIVIPNSVKTIAGSAFQGCSMLNKLVVGNGVGIIGVSAFEGCEKLKTVINFSNLDIVKGATTHGYVAYYADIVVTDGLALNQTTLELTTGESAILTAIVASGDNNAVTWSSSNEDIATVNNGEVTALAAGTTTITAKTGDYEATCVVTVTQKFITVSNITLSHTEVALTEGESLTLKATVSPDDATDKTVTWSTSDATIATVDNNGVVTAVAAGTATIIAKARDKTATCMVAVVSKGLIANPSFEGGTYGCDNGTGNGNLQAPEGWEVTYTYADWGWKNFQLVKDGNQQDGDQYFELWGYTYHTVDLSQELKNLPAGTYCLSAAMRTERADQVTNQHIYVKVNGKEIPSAVLEAPKGSAWNAVDAWQTLTVIFTLDAESDVVIGATSTGGAGSAGWFQIDNFRLDYSKYGEYYLYHAESKRFLARGEHWGTCATVDRYGIPFVWTAEEYSLKFLDSNVHLFETDDSNIYTDNASTGFTFEAVEGGYLLKSQKSNRYLTIVDAAFTHQIVNVTDDASAAVVWQLKSKAEHDAIVAGYVEENYMNVIKAAGLTTTAGDFADYLATVNAEDKTSAIGTARFNGSAGEWSFTEVRHQDWQPAIGTDFCELWMATGSYTQTITGLAEGIYKVSVQGFERSGWWDVCVALGEKGYEITTATLSANGEEVNLKSWLSGKTDENNPDNTGQAVAKFNEGKYMNEVYTYVGEDGTLTLTVCKPSHVGGNWIVFNNFTLTRYAEESTGIENSVLEAQGSQLIYDLQGRRVENPTKGIYIVNGKKVVIR